jgi:hypothetical protein
VADLLTHTDVTPTKMSRRRPVRCCTHECMSAGHTDPCSDTNPFPAHTQLVTHQAHMHPWGYLLASCSHNPCVVLMCSRACMGGGSTSTLRPTPPHLLVQPPPHDGPRARAHAPCAHACICAARTAISTCENMALHTVVHAMHACMQGQQHSLAHTALGPAPLVLQHTRIAHPVKGGQAGLL